MHTICNKLKPPIMILWLTGATVALLGGCSTFALSRPKPVFAAATLKPLTPEERDRLVQAAKGALGKSQLSAGSRTFRADCSGAIRAIFAQAQVRLGGILKDDADNDVKLIYRYVKKYGQIIKTAPQQGDLIFFHNTFDRSRNGRLNDALTHVGIVEKVEGSTVSFIHHMGKSVIRSRMDLEKPHLYRHPEDQTRLNHMLRKPEGPHPAYTAAQLFAGFGRL